MIYKMQKREGKERFTHTIEASTIQEAKKKFAFGKYPDTEIYDESEVYITHKWDTATMRPVLDDGDKVIKVVHCVHFSDMVRCAYVTEMDVTEIPDERILCGYDVHEEITTFLR